MIVLTIPLQKKSNLGTTSADGVVVGPIVVGFTVVAVGSIEVVPFAVVFVPASTKGESKKTGKIFNDHQQTYESEADRHL